MGHPSHSIPLEVTRALRAARRVVVLTGAGISSESGVPTFRDAQTGLWAKYNPEELATPEAFSRNPRLVWDWYAWRRDLVAKAEPNAGHLALVEMERRVPSFTLVTQNVDDLHRRAGSRNIIELHGNIHRTKCSAEGTLMSEWAATGEIPPRCPRCSALLRPDVVWFGESLHVEALAAAVEASRSCDYFLSVGTSSLVQPAASLPLEAIRHGVMVIEINPSATPLTPQVTYSLRGTAGDILPKLVEGWPDMP